MIKEHFISHITESIDVTKKIVIKVKTYEEYLTVISICTIFISEMTEVQFLKHTKKYKALGGFGINLYKHDDDYSYGFCDISWYTHRGYSVIPFKDLVQKNTELSLKDLDDRD